MAFPSWKKILSCFNCCPSAKNAVTVLADCTDSCLGSRPPLYHLGISPAAAQSLSPQPTGLGDGFTWEQADLLCSLFCSSQTHSRGLKWKSTLQRVVK